MKIKAKRRGKKVISFITVASLAINGMLLFPYLPEEKFSFQEKMDDSSEKKDLLRKKYQLSKLKLNMYKDSKYQTRSFSKSSIRL